MSAVDRVLRAFRRIAEADRPEVWITLRPEGDAVQDAAAVVERCGAGEALPLAGIAVAVKDNIDVAGLPTTAGCPGFAYVPERSAPAVQRLVAAGAIILGKTNMDQFATGLVGTRSPYGAVRDARRPDYVAGGSSSGSAVAVALGMVDVALGTDTAGSGRVPAAFAGIIGMKPTRGRVSTLGVVAACRTLDCVSVFAPDAALARAAVAAIAGPEDADPLGRAWPADAPLAAPPAPVLGVPDEGDLRDLTPDARRAFAALCAQAEEAGATLRAVGLAPFVDAGRLLYDGAFVAERYAAVGGVIDAGVDGLDQTVCAIIRSGSGALAVSLVDDGARLDALRVATRDALAGLDALLLPTTTRQPTLAEVAADPIGANAKLGRFTTCANLLDLCAVAVPAGEADGGRFGAMLLAGAHRDEVVLDIAADLLGEARPAAVADARALALFVVGAHLSGQPLNGQLERVGARLRGAARTAPAYRLHRLATEPPKPGLRRVSEGGKAVAGEVWNVPPVGLATLLADLPAPMALGRVELEDGCAVVGFLCEPVALDGARDITADGGWVAHLDRARDHEAALNGLSAGA